jgi:hypothetical protein
MSRLARTGTKTIPARRAGATPGPLDDSWRFRQRRRPKQYGRTARKFPAFPFLRSRRWLTSDSRYQRYLGILSPDFRNVPIEFGNPERALLVFVLPLGRTKDGLDKEQCFVWLSIMFHSKI